MGELTLFKLKVETYVNSTREGDVEAMNVGLGNQHSADFSVGSGQGSLYTRSDVYLAPAYASCAKHDESKTGSGQSGNRSCPVFHFHILFAQRMRQGGAVHGSVAGSGSTGAALHQAV